MTLSDKRLAKFHLSYVVNPENGCHEWTGTLNRDGYGWFVAFGEKLAHRVAYILSGRKLGKFVVRHMCDNRKCVNAAHLRRGTRFNNFQDTIGKGTMGQHRRLLTIEEQKEIRRRRTAGERGSELAREFRVSQQTVCDIYKSRHGNYA